MSELRDKVYAEIFEIVDTALIGEDVYSYSDTTDIIIALCRQEAIDIIKDYIEPCCERNVIKAIEERLK